MESGISSQVATVDYLELLTVQLRNQDPLEPADQGDLIRDLAQFSSLEGIEKLNGTFEEVLKLQEITQGTSLVDKNVQYQDAVSGEVKSGRVEQFFSSGNDISLVVNGDTISIDNIIGVSAGTT